MNGEGLAAFTDLYELTMVQAYLEEGMLDRAVFSLFSRRLPEPRNYLLASGIDTVLELLETVSFTEDQVDYLGTLPQFNRRFLDWARQFRFTGSIRAVADGTPVFANEPILEVTAPLPEAQLLETLIMNQVSVETVLASKASRIVHAARGRAVIDFGARRMHGIDASLKAARAFHIAGIKATSNVLAGHRYGIPVSGTMAHSYIQAHDSEMDAFRAFTRLYPETVLLVDSYDTLAGVAKVIALARERGDDFAVQSIRLDSGDLADLSKEARDMLDEAGLRQVKIFASSGLDEYGIDELLARDAPIDGFGIGTHMGVASDAPGLDLAYKLCEYAGRGRLKLSSSKPIMPGPKQVFRVLDDNGAAIRDVIARAEESLDGEPLLHLCMENGRRLAPPRKLDDIRDRTAAEIDRLPASIRRLAPVPASYPVAMSDALSQYHEAVKKEVESHD